MTVCLQGSRNDPAGGIIRRTEPGFATVPCFEPVRAPCPITPGCGPMSRNTAGDGAAVKPFMDPAVFVFIDVAGANARMVRHHGWVSRGEHMVDAALHGSWRTTTFVVGLRDL